MRGFVCRSLLAKERKACFLAFPFGLSLEKCLNFFLAKCSGSAYKSEFQTKLMTGERHERKYSSQDF